MRLAPVTAGLLLLGCLGCRQILGFDDPEVRDAAVDAAPDAVDFGPTDDGWRSGSRLKLRWNDYAGTRDYTGVFDTVLGQACFPVLWTDGKRYCSPNTGIAPGTGIAYKDAACTQAVGERYRIPAACLPQQPAVIAERIALGCVGFARSRLFHRGPQILPPPPVHYVKDTIGNCTVQGFTSIDLFELGPEILREDLVEMTATTTPTGGRLAHGSYVGSDGASVPTQLFDTAIDVACSPTSAGPCVPSSSTSYGTYGDASCIEPLSRGAVNCPAPRFATRTVRPGCTDPGYEVFNTGAKLSPPMVYSQSTNACTATAPDSSVDYYPATTRVSLVTVTRAIVPRTTEQTQVTVSHYTDGTARIRTGLYDHVHSTFCANYGGTGRCLPDGVGVTRYFTDPGCTAPLDLAVHLRPPAVCPEIAIAPKFALKATNGECSATYEVYRVGTQHTGTVYTGAPGTCSVYADPNFVLYGLAGLMRLDEFAAATPMIAP